MTRLADKLDKIAKDFQIADSEDYTLTDEEIELLDPKFIAFYNAKKTDIDLFKVSNHIEGKKGYIFMVKLPYKNAQKIGGSTDFGLPRWNFIGTLFSYYGVSERFSAFLTKAQWTIIMDEYETIFSRRADPKKEDKGLNLVIFIYGGLNYKYHKIGDIWKKDDPARNKRKIGGKIILKLSEFLARHGLEDIEQLNKHEWVYYYSTNAWKVIL